MNDIERAIEVLKKQYRNPYADYELRLACKASIEALEKQIPHKLKTRYDNEFTDADGNRGMLVRHIECPNCESEMFIQFEYCPECGQKLDWSEA